MADFCNRTTNDFANVTAVTSPRGVASYLEFSTKFSDGTALETNTNKRPPLTPASPQARAFRFPGISAPEALYKIHRQLAKNYAGGMWLAREPRDSEIQRLVRVFENYGPRHMKIGYMKLTKDESAYRLTWKGPFLMTWSGLWSTSLVRRTLERRAMRVERHELEGREVAALQKA